MKARRVAGRTLLELMVALAIGTLLLVGVASLYLAASRVSRVAGQTGSAEDSGRVAMTLIGEGIKGAGYGEIVGTEPMAKGQTLFDGPVVRGCTGSRFVDAFNARSPDYRCAAAAPGDQVLIRFQGRYAVVPMDAGHLLQSALPDCLGASNAHQDAVLAPSAERAGAGASRRIVQSAFALDETGTVLRCEGNGNPGVPAPFVNDVVDFRVFYRFDDAGHMLAANGESSYAPVGGSVRDAAWINGIAAGSAADPWLNVVAVIVCITVTTRERGTVVAGSAATRCPRTAEEAAAATVVAERTEDARLRRTFIDTFTIRSQATGAPSIAPHGVGG